MEPPPVLFHDIRFDAICSILNPIDMDIGLDYSEDLAWIGLIEPGEIIDKSNRCIASPDGSQEV